jgi:hypothetical protein
MVLTAAQRDVQGRERVLRRHNKVGRTAVRGWDRGCQVSRASTAHILPQHTIMSICTVSHVLIELRIARKAVVPAATAWRARPAHPFAPGRTQAAARLPPSTCLISSCLLCVDTAVLLLSIQTASTARSCAARTATRDSVSMQPL